MVMINIRKFRGEDADKVSDIIKKCIKEVYPKYYPKEVLDFTYRYMSNINFVELSKEREFFVATKEDEVVGIIGLKKDEVKAFYVDPKLHNQGIGKKLMEHIEKIAKERNYKKLEVKSSLYAVEVYKSCGFQKLITIKTPVGKTELKEVLLAKRLTKSKLLFNISNLIFIIKNKIKAERFYKKFSFGNLKAYIRHIAKKAGYGRIHAVKKLSQEDRTGILELIKQLGEMERFISYPRTEKSFSRSDIDFCMNVIFDRIDSKAELDFAKINKLNFDDIYAISKGMKCQLLFFNNLRNKDLLPAPLLKRLSFELSLNKIMLKHFCEGIGDLTEVAEKNGIDFILMKGLSLASYYPQLYLRGSGDIDIIAGKKSAKLIFEKLKNLGYKQEHNNARNYRNYKKMLSIETHHKLLHEEWFGKGMRDDYEFVSENSESANIAGYTLNVPNPEMLLYMLCSHILHHLYYDKTLYKNNFVDMYYLLKNNPKLDWGRFFSLIEDEYYKTCFNEILNTFSRITGLELKGKNIYI